MVIFADALVVLMVYFFRRIVCCVGVFLSTFPAFSLMTSSSLHFYGTLFTFSVTFHHYYATILHFIGILLCAVICPVNRATQRFCGVDIGHKFS